MQEAVPESFGKGALGHEAGGCSRGPKFYAAFTSIGECGNAVMAWFAVVATSTPRVIAFVPKLCQPAEYRDRRPGGVSASGVLWLAQGKGFVHVRGTNRHKSLCGKVCPAGLEPATFGFGDAIEPEYNAVSMGLIMLTYSRSARLQVAASADEKLRRKTVFRDVVPYSSVEGRRGFADRNRQLRACHWHCVPYHQVTVALQACCSRLSIYGNGVAVVRAMRRRPEYFSRNISSCPEPTWTRPSRVWTSYSERLRIPADRCR
jgi:hypothetical protein